MRKPYESTSTTIDVKPSHAASSHCVTGSVKTRKSRQSNGLQSGFKVCTFSASTTQQVMILKLYFERVKVRKSRNAESKELSVLSKGSEGFIK
jgi:hypothetical protein